MCDFYYEEPRKHKARKQVPETEPELEKIEQPAAVIIKA
jgi:hypothetical protein